MQTELIELLKTSVITSVIIVCDSVLALPLFSGCAGADTQDSSGQSL